MFDLTQPFVLLDDARGQQARLFTGLIETLVADTPDAVIPALDRLRTPGPWAGFIGFEAGYALEPRLVPRTPPPGEPLLWFGRFASERRVETATLLGDAPATAGPAMPTVARAWYDRQLAAVLALIAAGDIYQANLTFAATVPVAGHPLALYARLRAGSRAPHGALVFTGSLWLLSFSPELFFRLDGAALTARPMKGTATRGTDAGEDAALAAGLRADPKTLAENLMIVDLLRNDLSRVAHGVQVPALFEVETYPTVLQMTSTVTATADPGIVAADVLARLFPCGSVTGAPKIRAMEVIAALEAAPRGVYTGSIGAIAANGDASFNVAIRTLVWRPGEATARAGLGSGIVADSEADAEWAECLAKAAFLGKRGAPDIIETMRVEAGQIADLDRHLARAAATARFLGTPFDPPDARTLALAAAAGITARLRLLVSPAGALAVETAPLPTVPPRPVTVAIVPLPVAPDDWRLRHKTSDRSFYDAARAAGGTFEVVLARPDGQLTEGSFTSLFVARGDTLLTPPLAAGLLPGILRARLIDEGRAHEARLTPADLRDGFFIGNALRGLLPARLA